MRATVALRAFFIAILALSLIRGEIVPFETTWSGQGGSRAYVQTQLDISSATSASRATACVNDNVLITPTVANSLWYPNSFEAAITSNAVDSAHISGPFGNFGGGTPNQAIRWVTASQYSTITSHTSPAGTPDFFTNRPEWDTFWGPLGGAQEVGERVHYLMGASGNNYFTTPDGSYAPSLFGIYCRSGQIGLVSSNPSYNRILVSADYTGGPLPLQTIPLSSPGTVTFSTQADVAGCAASGFTLLTPGSGRVDTGEIYDTAPFSHTFGGNTVSIQVETPISCQNLAVVSHTVPGTVQANTIFPFTFTLQNPMGREITIPVGGISLAAGSQFSLLAFPPGQLPRTIPAGGQSTLTATVRAPSSSGTFPFQLQLSYSTTQPDCTGNTIDCSQPLTLANVVVPPPGNPPVSCSLFPPSTAIDPGGSRTFTATCSDSNGAPAECPGFDWSENVQQASLQFPSTPPAPNPTNTLNVQLTAPQQTGREVRATYNSEGFPVFSCNSVVGINAPPPRPNLVCNMSISGDGTPEVGEPVTVSITTRNIGNQNAIPLNPPIVTRLREFDSEPPNPLERDFTYNSLPPGGSITHQATYNCELAGHVSYAGIADWTSQVDEGFSESDNTCSLAFDCTSPNLEPVSCWIEPASLTVQIGGPSHLAWVFCNASSGAPAPCNPLTNWDVQPGAIATVSPQQGLQTSVTGVLIGSGALRARYPASQPYDYECSVPLQVQSGGFSFPDLVVTAIPVSNPNPMENETVSIWVTVQNVDSAAAGASQTGLLVDSYREPNWLTPSLSYNQSVTLGPWVHTCLNPNNSTTLVGIADVANNVDEDGNEGNNRLSRTINCTLDVPSPLLPDYVGAISFIPAAPDAGDDVLIVITTRNTGADSLSRSFTNLTIDGAPFPPFSFRIPPLGGGELRNSHYDYTACPQGSHIIAANVDANDDVDEANEGNNLVTAPLSCLGQAQLFCYDYI